GSEIAVIADHAVRLRNDPRAAQKILDVILRAPASGQHGNAFAAEEDVFGRGVARAVGFRQDFVPRAVPIKLTTGLVDPAAIAVIEIVHAGGGFRRARPPFLLFKPLNIRLASSLKSWVAFGDLEVRFRYS